MIVCASVTTKQLDTAGHVISWKFPGNFRETACKPTTARATGETHLLTVLLRLLSFGFDLLAAGSPAGLVSLAVCTEQNRCVRHTGTFMEPSRKSPEGPGGGS